MTKHITKSKSKPLVHHPSDALDPFGRYDDSNESWLKFSDSLSGQIARFEDHHPHYILVRPEVRRRAIA